MNTNTKMAVDWEALRKDFPLANESTYFDSPSFGLLSKQLVQAEHARAKRLMHEGIAMAAQWQFEQRNELRSVVAQNINGQKEGVALVPSFSNGLMLLAPLIRHRKKVLVVRGDYPTIPPPFRVNGYELAYLDAEENGSIPLDNIAKAVERERPGIVAISHVQWTSGFRIDPRKVAEVCHAHDALLLVDATQSWCAVPLDVQAMGIDILGASGYKWPLAGFGNGFFHLSENVRSEIEATHPKPVDVLMPGHTDPLAFLRMQDALARVAELGVDRIAARITSLCALLIAEPERIGVKILSSVEEDHRSPLIIIEGDQARMDHLKANCVHAALRGKGIRIGPHCYTNEADVDRLMEVLVKK